MSVKAFSTIFPPGAGTIVEERRNEVDEARKKYESLRVFDFVLILSQFLAIILIILVGESFLR